MIQSLILKTIFCFFLLVCQEVQVQFLKDQNTKSKSDDKKMLANLDNVKEMGYKSREFLEKEKPISLQS